MLTHKANSSLLLPLIPLGLWLIGMAVLLACCLHMTDGHLIYSLDDPYIHLAVASNILHFSYGVNLTEYASPSSSIIYPFLLALTEYLGLGGYGPLVINIMAMAAAVYVSSRVIQTDVMPDEMDSLGVIFYIVITMLFCCVINSWSIVMTGMGCSLHILLVTVLIWCFLEIIRNPQTTDKLLIFSIVMLPLVRFEGLAQAMFAIIALFYLKRVKSALIAIALLTLVMLAWANFTQALGLPLFPSSVQLKSKLVTFVMSGSSVVTILQDIVNHFVYDLSYPQDFLRINLYLLIILTAIFWDTNQQLAIVIGGVAVLTGLVHLFAGHYSDFGRYEMYAVTVIILSVMVMSKPYLINNKRILIVIMYLMMVGIMYFPATLITPLACKNIYQQQYQMHRFVSEFWRRPVAVNDLGLVSYNNDNYVLDLVGLGSEEVRILKQADMLTPAAMANLVNKKHIKLIMIYTGWFGNIPSSWQKIAVLRTLRISASYGEVVFFVTKQANTTQVRQLLKQFARTLPRDVTFEIY